MRMHVLFTAVLLTATVPVAAVMAQRGIGQKEGIARQPDKPKVESIAGELKEVKTGPCEFTTGRSGVGTHFILETKDGTVNLHLGPVAEVKDVVGMFHVGDKVQASAFRTSQLPEKHYVAVSVKSGDKEIALRDTSLRPRWAGAENRRPGRGMGLGSGKGPAAAGGPGLVSSVVLAQASQIDLTSEQETKIKAILADAEKRIREVLNDSQVKALDSRPLGRQAIGPGPRWAR